MTDAWGMVIAAGVGGVFALFGSFIGFRVGRRQVQDQAQVEHLQWLRGQRQAAYVAFLDAWDQAMAQIHGQVEAWDEMIAYLPYYEGDGEEAMAASVTRDLSAAIATVRPTGERVQLLGTAGIDSVAVNMSELLLEMCRVIEGSLPGSTAPTEWSEYGQAHEAGMVQRVVFLSRAREEMHVAPQPGKSPRRALRPGQRY
ncbi:hypothetical protein [Streptomyces sp. NPDC048527]|uniref:hypothetical protein n=1 Tax=Streptomyces sp. NPDC048527 TaxID=3365568 RepID=UPI003715A08B